MRGHEVGMGLEELFSCVEAVESLESDKTKRQHLSRPPNWIGSLIPDRPKMHPAGKSPR